MRRKTADNAAKRCIELLTFLAAASALSTAAAAQGALQAGDNPDLVAEYRFDTGAGDTVYDTAGNNDGTINGATWTEGKKGDGLLFDSSSEDYVQTSNTLDIPQKYSMFIWIKGDLNDQLSENIYPFGFNNKVELAASSSSNARGGILIRDEADDSYHSVWDGTNVLDGEWHHWGATVNRNTGTAKIYLDGEKIHEETIPDHYSDSRKINIGSWSDTYGHFNGKIDEARLYSEALNTSEVKSAYNTGSWRVGTSNNKEAPSKVLDMGFQHVQNGQVLDTSGNSNHGDIENGASQAEAVECKVGRCLSFDGNDDYVELPSNKIGNWGELTIGAWIKAPEYSGDKWPAYVGGSTTSTGNNVGIGIWRDTNHQWLEVDTSNGNYAMEGSLSIPWGEWYYATLNYNGSHLTEYINGKKGKSIPASGSLKDLDIGIHLGRQAGVNYYFDGKIDQLRIYKRSLSNKEVWKLYTRGRDRTSNGIPGPAAHYPINVESSPLRDISGEGNEGSLDAVGEVGTFNTRNGIWKKINFNGEYENPVVIGTANTHSGDPALSFETRDVRGDSAEMRVCESEAEQAEGCDTHGTERVGYMVIDAADTGNIPGIEAGSFQIDGNHDSNTNTVSYSESFSNTPIVMANVNTDSGNNPVEARVVGHTSSDFTAGICYQNSDDGCENHPTETVGWVAVEPGNIPFEQSFEVGSTGPNVGGSSWYFQSFSTSFSEKPVVTATTLTDNGGQGLLIDEVRNIDTNGAEVRYCEAENGDGCNGHNEENVGWFAAEKGLLTQTGTNTPTYVDTERGKALEFDGNDDRVVIGEPDIDLTDSISICLRIKPHDMAAQRENLIDKSYGGEFSFTLEDRTGGHLSTYFGSAGGDSKPYTGNDWENVASDGDWSNLCWVRDNEAQDVKLYKNGRDWSEHQTSSGWESPSQSSDPLVIGDGYTNTFDGQIDDVSIYPYALNQEQISQVMNSGGVSISG